MTTVDQIKALSVRETLQIMEAIWEDLRERFEGSDLSDSKKRLLDERSSRVSNGSARMVDWDSVKGSLGRQ